MHSDSLIGVVTVTYNSAGVIAEFMDSLLQQTYRNFRLYVVDNASSDDTLKLIARYSDPRVITIPSSTNVGVAEGNNIGIKAALADGCASVLLINNDTVFEADLISRLNDGFRIYQCDMIAPKILYFEPPQKIWSAGGAFSLLRGRSKHLGFNKKDDGSFDKAQEIKYSPTCCMLIREEVFRRVGLMDRRYFVYFDDADFCMRASRAGVKLVYMPSARLFHKVSSLIGHRSDTAIRYVTRNHAYFVLKHFSSTKQVYYLPVCQAHILVRCLFAKNAARAFVIAQKAFWEGISLFRESRARQSLAQKRYWQHKKGLPKNSPASAYATKASSARLEASENGRP